MSPLAHYTAAFRRYADFRGRTGRPGYWYFSLLSILAWFAVSLVSAGLGVLYVLAAFLPALGVTIRASTTPIAADGGAWSRCYRWSALW